jgi:hypothetical protein
MGEIAEAILEGLLDEETGELIDGTAPGYPRRMSDRGRIPSGCIRQGSAQKQVPHAPLNAKDLKWLKAAAYMPQGSSMYPGEYWEAAPARFRKLERRGLVALYEPHNSAHKNRAVATEAGRALIAEFEKAAS